MRTIRRTVSSVKKHDRGHHKGEPEREKPRVIYNKCPCGRDHQPGKGARGAGAKEFAQIPDRGETHHTVERLEQVRGAGVCEQCQAKMAHEKRPPVLQHQVP